MPREKIRNFVSFDVRRKGNQLNVEDYEIIGPLSTRGGKRRDSKGVNGRNIKAT